jgi:ATP-dependent RNA helicase DDX10/DBP4
MNILVATPGRLLQHMNETHDFDYDSIKVMAIDEVDRVLDMGFRESLDQIMKNVPAKAQKILVSATVSKSL